MAVETWDRTKFTPQHNGINVLPCMVCLLSLATGLRCLWEYANGV